MTRFDTELFKKYSAGFDRRKMKKIKIQRNNTSGYRGVTWHKLSNKWMAFIQFEGKQHTLGLFTNKLDAAKAYDTAAKKMHKNFAVLNFPDGEKDSI